MTACARKGNDWGFTPSTWTGKNKNPVPLPNNSIFGLFWDRNFGREYQRLPPVHNFPIRVLWILRAKRWVADQHFIHDHPEWPPIASRSVSRLQKYFGRYVVRGTDGAVRQGSPVLLPTLRPPLAIHRTRRYYCKLLKINTNTQKCLATLTKIRRLRLAQIPVEIGPVGFLQTGAQPKIGELQVTLGVQQ